MEDFDVEEVTGRQVASALGVPPRTVAYWIRKRGLAGWKPFDSDRAGYRTTVGDVRTFLSTQAQDNGRSLERFNRWVNQTYGRGGAPKTGGK